MKWLKDDPRYAAQDARKRNIRRGDLGGQLYALLAEHGSRKTGGKRRRTNDGRKVGHSTRHKRRGMLHDALDELRHHESCDFPGMKLESLANLKLKHAVYLKNHWFARGLAGKTIDNKISMLRRLYEWVGKANAIPPNQQWLTGAEYAWISNARADHRDKTPRAAGLDAEAVTALINEIEKTDVRVGAALRIERAFGIRVKEALLFRPLQDVRADHIRIRHGAKNGRPRTLYIETDAQRDAIEYVKVALGSRDWCLVPHDKSYQQGRDRYYNVLKRHGVTRQQLGFTSHGLRQDHLIDTFQKTSGQPAPVRGGRDAVNPEAAERGRRKATGVAGHGRTAVMDAYAGSDRDKTPDELRRLAQEAVLAAANMTPAEQAALIARVQPGRHRNGS